MVAQGVRPRRTSLLHHTSLVVERMRHEALRLWKRDGRSAGVAPGWLLLLLALAVVAVPPGRAAAAEACSPAVGEVVSVEGEVVIQADGDPTRPAATGAPLCQEDTIRTGPLSRAAIRLANDAVLRLDQETVIRLADVALEESRSSLVQLVLGAFQSFSRRPHRIDVDAPHVNLAVRGTEFLVRTDGRESLLAVQEGEVLASNAEGQLAVSDGEAAVARSGEAPQPYLRIRPRDAVEWALHYPPVLALTAPDGEILGTEAAPARREVMRLARAGDTAGALAALDRAPADGPAADLLRAALLLDVGRVDAARTAIDRALAAEPGSGAAYALLAVIDVAQNRTEAALANGRRAVELSPRSAAARIALSYARQAAFDLAGARDDLLQAVADQPEDAMAWARLAEVWLMLGERERAREAAARAAALAPDLPRAQTVRGFADLAEFRARTAREAFGQAIAADPGAPLPRFGLGLAEIRQGDLPKGRADIEAAVALDPNNPLLRAYLGKAYFEERREDLAGQQYAIAKELDPRDPTAHLYDAILKQTLNRPVEALRELERSIELNDNRAVYRSRLQLDEDRAARGTSLARIYDDLGFQPLGLREATRSLAADPGNASAHRFLSDIYGGVRRREIARVSELLQAQLLQHVNINPVQPSLSETSLNVATGGPADPGFNEFTPLFERNRVQLNAAGVVGDEDTLGGEAVVSALHDWFSVSVGTFGYTTDGFRSNFDLEHEIHNVFAQAALTPELNLQLEFRHRESEEGDLRQDFDPDDFSRGRERTLDQDIARLGLRYSPTASNDFLFSAIGSRRDERIEDSSLFGPFLIDSDSRVDDDAYQIEGQHLFRTRRLNTTTGLAHADVDRELDIALDLDGRPFPDFRLPTEISHTRGYGYLNLNLPDPVTWTVGLSVDDYEEGDLKVGKVNPKLGVQWQLTDDVLLRAALFRTVKPALVSNRTIEPTQVAGFNQFFDDINGTAAWRYGVGLDWQLTREVHAGVEASWRELDEPLVLGDNFRYESREEQLYRTYVGWTPLPWLAVHAELAYDRYESESGIATDFNNLPEEVETLSLPLALRFFLPNGFFAGLGATYVHQEVDRSSLSSRAEGSDDFIVADASIGYRLPGRRGILSLEVRNLFDEGFQFQDDSYREFRDEPSVGPYIPERQIRLRFAVNF